jgi:hypothetical protein
MKVSGKWQQTTGQIGFNVQDCMGGEKNVLLKTEILVAADVTQEVVNKSF